MNNTYITLWFLYESNKRNNQNNELDDVPVSRKGLLCYIVIMCLLMPCIVAIMFTPLIPMFYYMSLSRNNTMTNSTMINQTINFI